MKVDRRVGRSTTFVKSDHNRSVRGRFSLDLRPSTEDFLVSKDVEGWAGAGG